MDEIWCYVVAMALATSGGGGSPVLIHVLATLRCSPSRWRKGSNETTCGIDIGIGSGSGVVFGRGVGSDVGIGGYIGSRSGVAVAMVVSTGRRCGCGSATHYCADLFHQAGQVRIHSRSVITSRIHITSLL